MGWFEDNGYDGFGPKGEPTPDPWMGEGYWNGSGWLPPGHPDIPNKNDLGALPPSYGGNGTPETPAPQPGGQTPPVVVTEGTPPAQDWGNAPAGWDTEKWNDQNHQTPKYAVGRILNKYPHTPDGLKQALPEIQALYPGVKITGSKGDKLDFGDTEHDGVKLGVIDVVQGAANGGDNWNWGAEDNDGPTNSASGNTTPWTPPGTSPTGTNGMPTGTGTWTPPSGGGGGTAAAPSAFTPPASPEFTPYQATPYQAPTPYQFNQYQPSGMGAPTSGGGAYQSTAFNPPSIAPGPMGSTPGLNAAGTVGPYQGPGVFGAPNTLASSSPLEDRPGFNYTPVSEREDFSSDPLKSTDDFKAPTGQQALDDDPGYQFRMQQGLQALQQSAAGKGVLHTGGTLSGIVDYGQKAASQEYGNAYQRARDTHFGNQGVRQGEQDQQFQQAKGSYALNNEKGLATNAQQFGQQATGEGINTANAFNVHNINANTGRQDQAQQFGQALSTQQQNLNQGLSTQNANLASQGQGFNQAAQQQAQNYGQGLSSYNANLAAQAQGYGQAANTAQMNEGNAFNAWQANTANQNTDAALAANIAQTNNAQGLQAWQANANQGLATNAQNTQNAQWGAGFNQAGNQQTFQNQFNNANAAATHGQNAANSANAFNLGQQGATTAANAQQAQAELGFANLGLSAQQQGWMQQYLAQGMDWGQAFAYAQLAQQGAQG